jgi:MFS-type transporter involved in bile tolerance (Atg22 family)
MPPEFPIPHSLTIALMAIMNDDVQRHAEILTALKNVRRRMKVLTVAVILMALAVFAMAGTVFGFLTNYFSGEGMMYGSSLVGAAMVSFWCGWFARRRA